MRRVEPALRLGWSVPKAQRDYTDSILYKLPALVGLEVVKRVLPGRAAAAIRAGRCEAIDGSLAPATRALVRAVDAAGGELYVWTVDDVAQIRALEAIGVTGVITNDPRLFGPAGLSLSARSCTSRASRRGWDRSGRRSRSACAGGRSPASGLPSATR